MLGGAKNYMIVLPDADMDATLEACSGSIFGSTGQRCLAGSVIVGVGDAHAEIRDRMLDSAASIRLGDGLLPGTDMGPLISAAHRDRVNAFIGQGESDGAKLPYRPCALSPRDAEPPIDPGDCGKRSTE